MNTSKARLEGLIAVPLLLLCILLTHAGCSNKSYPGTLVKKDYHPAYVATRNETQIIRGTLHESVPTQYVHPDWFIVYLRTAGGTRSTVPYQAFLVKKAVYDTLKIGRLYTPTKAWRPLRTH